MRGLYNKLTEYLSEEYTPEEVHDQLSTARIRKVTRTRVEIVYDNGILEKLKLKKDKLISEHPMTILRAKW